MSVRRAALAAAVAAAVVAAPSVAPAAPTRAQKLEARGHFERGSRAYAEGRFADAVTELQAGYELDPRPDFLYALGQAERQRGDCKAAIGYYKRFVDTGPSAQKTVAAQMQIDRCEQALAAAPPPPAPPPPVAAPAPAPPPAAAPAVVATAPAPAEHTPVYKRWWLWTAVVGVAAVGVGVGVGVAMSQRNSFSPTLPDLVITKSALTVRF